MDVISTATGPGLLGVGLVAALALGAIWIYRRARSQRTKESDVWLGPYLQRKARWWLGMLYRSLGRRPHRNDWGRFRHVPSFCLLYW